MSAVIERITITSLVIPVAKADVHSPEFAYEPLNRGPTGGFDGPWFAQAPICVVQVQSQGRIGWGRTLRTTTVEQLAQAARELVGRPLTQVHADDWPHQGAELRGLHSAALDCAAKVRGVPLYRMFGAKVRPSVRLADWAGMHTPSGAARFARRTLERQRGALKLKGCEKTDLPGLARAVQQVAAEFPDQTFELVVDPNGRWTTDSTVAMARQLADLKLHLLLEDPVYGKELFIRTLKQVGEVSSIGGLRTVALAEDVDAYVDALPNLAGFNIVGSWPGIRRCAAAATQRGKPFWCGSSMDSGISDLATLHFVSTQPLATFPAEIAGYDKREHHLLAQPLDIRAGHAYLSDAPGLGIDVDLDAVRRYTVGTPVVLER